MRRLVDARYLGRWSDLRLIAHHGGGTVPMLAGRCKVLPTAPGDEAVAERLVHAPLHDLKRFHADTANGSDFGYNRRSAPETIDDIETVISDEATERAIYERDARRVLRLDDAPFPA